MPPFPPPRSLPMPLLRHSPALAPHRIPEQPFGHARDTVGFEKRAYTLVYEWRKCDITMPATATSAIATAASADADADGFSAAYLRSCRHQYCGAGVLLLSRDRRKPMYPDARMRLRYCDRSWNQSSSSSPLPDLQTEAYRASRMRRRSSPMTHRGHASTPGPLP